MWEAANYSCTFRWLIKDWRAKWSVVPGTTSANLPFGFVQLAAWCNCTAPYTKCNNSIPTSVVAPLRWAQTANFGYVPNPLMPNVFMSTAVDLPDLASPDLDIHPRSKQPVGARLALCGWKYIYGSDIDYCQGPFPTSFTVIHNGTFWGVRIDHVGVGTGLLSTGYTNIVTYELIDAKGNAYYAPVYEVHSNVVAVGAYLPANVSPVSIRNLWRDEPCPNQSEGGDNCLIYSSYNLPALPFWLPLNYNMTTGTSYPLADYALPPKLPTNSLHKVFQMDYYT